MNDEVRTRHGEEYAEGVMKVVWRNIFLIFVVGVVVALARNQFNIMLDDSDKDGWNRSGMSIRTDHKTGIQYFSDGKGGLHVRLGTNGLPMRKDQR